MELSLGKGYGKSGWCKKGEVVGRANRFKELLGGLVEIR